MTIDIGGWMNAVVIGAFVLGIVVAPPTPVTGTWGERGLEDAGGPVVTPARRWVALSRRPSLF